MNICGSVMTGEESESGSALHLLHCSLRLGDACSVLYLSFQVIVSYDELNFSCVHLYPLLLLTLNSHALSTTVSLITSSGLFSCIILRFGTGSILFLSFQAI